MHTVAQFTQARGRTESLTSAGSRTLHSSLFRCRIRAIKSNNNRSTATLTRAETDTAFTLIPGPSIDVHWIRMLRQFIPIQHLYCNVWGHPACRDSLDVNATATHTAPRSTHEYCMWDTHDTDLDTYANIEEALQNHTTFSAAPLSLS